MKINFKNIDLTGFIKVPCMFGGKECVLIYPEDITIKFNEQNKYFRSSIWTLSGEPVSLGFRKFVNYGEQISFEPLDITDKNLTFPRKIDGSCCIVSKFNGELIIRTRQTTDARKMKNGDEIDFLINKYPKAFNNWYLNNGYTCLYEWTTPTNIIVLRESTEPTLWLTGIVNHKDYSYLYQNTLDIIAKEDFNVSRPETFKFDSFDEMRSACEKMSGKEGIVVYSGNGQILKKVKSFQYLYFHKLKSKFNSKENLIDFFLSNYCYDYDTCINILQNQVDFELAESVKDDIKIIAEEYKRAKYIITEMLVFIEGIRKLQTRKEQAISIMKYDKSHAYLGFAFLDRIHVTNEMYKKIMMEKK
jgi:hypothetical protein